jgi:hypothetical protein
MLQFTGVTIGVVVDVVLVAVVVVSKFIKKKYLTSLGNKVDRGSLMFDINVQYSRFCHSKINFLFKNTIF